MSADGVRVAHVAIGTGPSRLSRGSLLATTLPGASVPGATSKMEPKAVAVGWARGCSKTLT